MGTICNQSAILSTYKFAELSQSTFYISDAPISLEAFCAHFVTALGKGRAWRMPGEIIRALGRIGDLAGAVGLRFPINGLRANEMTRDYPVSIEPTLALTNTTTNYQEAAQRVVEWAFSDPEFVRQI